jgi:dihydrofolate reductase
VEDIVMAKVRVHNFLVSLDGYAAGPEQSLENPFGVGGMVVGDWFVRTQTFLRMQGKPGGSTGTDNDFAARWGVNVGAFIMGRNMFGPIRGEWPDESWQGWWGPEPPYHHPVFVLTHHRRQALPMAGGTTFHFTDDPIDGVLQRAFEVADGKDVQIGGGVHTVQQFLRAGLIDEIHLAIAPVLLGRGERLFDNLIDVPSGYQVTEWVGTPGAQHVVLSKKAG